MYLFCLSWCNQSYQTLWCQHIPSILLMIIVYIFLQDAPSSSPNEGSSKKRRSEKRERERNQEEIVCDRCNYTKDCCCTFSCKHCAKRIFSIMAYTLHSERTCPVLKQRRERIRMAIMEKRRRREIFINETASDLPDSAFSFADAYQLHAGFMGGSTSGNESGSRRRASELAKLKEESKDKSAENDSKPVDEDGDDSNSGSLTDLSTFTTPNILQPVTNASVEWQMPRRRISLRYSRFCSA